MSNVQKDKIEKLYEKAEQLYKAIQYKKAAKMYYRVAESFYEIKEFKIAQEAFFKAADSFIQKEDHEKVIKSLRKSINSYLELDDIENALILLEKTIDYIEKLKNQDLRESSYILFSFLSYICYYALGVPSKGLNVVKRAQKKVDKEFFKQNSTIHLITNFTIALRDKKKKNINKLTEDLHHVQLYNGEQKLVKNILLIAIINVDITPEIKLDKDDYITNEIIQMNMDIDIQSILETAKKDFYDFTIEEIMIKGIKINLTDNLSIQTKPRLPLILDLKSNFNYNFSIKPQFITEKSIIGPIKIEFLLNNLYSFYIENRNEIPITLSAPPTSLEVSLKSLKTPLIDKTFPLEILIENKSEGDASDLNINIKFPEQIRVIRGTIEKQIYSLRSNETIKWEISSRPLEAGDFEIEIDFSFKDPDNNDVEEKKIFPLAIKL